VLALGIVAAFAVTDERWIYGLVGTLLVAGIGLRDDLVSVPSIIRFLTHLIAACVLVVGLMPGLSFYLTDDLIVDGWMAMALAVGGIAWMINLFNFMDGIDGLAASEALFVCGTGAILLAWSSATIGIILPALAVASASAGLLVLNWPPARIFMGDVGSGFLGYAIACIALWSSASHVMPIWTWAILCGAFVTDATVTLVRRAMRGDRVYSSHRSHAYQKLARRWSSHKSATLAYIVVNSLWLLPLAILSMYWPTWSAWLCALALAPLAFGVWRVGAGLPD
jgi:Fuc2NAc and GlcNAc transferase